MAADRLMRDGGRSARAATAPARVSGTGRRRGGTPARRGRTAVPGDCTRQGRSDRPNPRGRAVPQDQLDPAGRPGRHRLEAPQDLADLPLRPGLPRRGYPRPRSPRARRSVQEIRQAPAGRTHQGHRPGPPARGSAPARPYGRGEMVHRSCRIWGHRCPPVCLHLRAQGAHVARERGHCVAAPVRLGHGILPRRCQLGAARDALAGSRPLRAVPDATEFREESTRTARQISDALGSTGTEGPHLH
jgi:hypothetical protein